MSWDNRKLWGIEFTGSDKSKMLIGSIWHKAATATYEGEPTRALLFTTRAIARAWCKKENVIYKDRDDPCAKWRWRCVPVIESVKIIKQ